MSDTAIKVKNSLKYSVYDGAYCSIMVGFGESFFQPFFLVLHQSQKDYTWLVTLPITLGLLSQILSAWLMKQTHNRRLTVAGGVLMQALSFLPLMFIGCLSNVFWFLLAFLCIYYISGTIIVAIWSSWMGDLVPENERGDYFGRRNRICGFIALSAAWGAGLIMDLYRNKGQEMFGFVMLFVIAILTRLISFLYVTRMFDPPHEPEEPGKYNIVNFVGNELTSNYGKFVLYMCMVNIGIWVAQPFFTPYLKDDLKFSYQQYSFILMVVAGVSRLIAMPIWGKLADRYGNRKIIVLCGQLSSIGPILWIFSSDYCYLIGVQFFNGLVWAGFEIAVFNFIFDTTDPKLRTSYIANYYILVGVSVLIGGQIGNYLVDHSLTKMLGFSAFFIVFIVSGIIRVASTNLFIHHLKEVRDVERISYTGVLAKFFNIIWTRPRQV